MPSGPSSKLRTKRDSSGDLRQMYWGVCGFCVGITDVDCSEAIGRQAHDLLARDYGDAGGGVRFSFGVPWPDGADTEWPNVCRGADVFLVPSCQAQSAPPSPADGATLSWLHVGYGGSAGGFAVACAPGSTLDSYIGKCFGAYWVGDLWRTWLRRYRTLAKGRLSS